MSEAIKDIERHREAILLGEIGALLHDFGKMDQRFVRKHSLEGGNKDYNHASKDLFSSDLLQNLKALEINFREDLKARLIDLIVEHHDPKPSNKLVKGIIECDHMNSADDKGVVRKKQPISDMWITTPFGCKVAQIDPDSLDRKRKEMDRQLVGIFASYLNSQSPITVLRNEVQKILEHGLSCALGETREPANDVTLWEHSYGVASLFKSILSTIAVEREIDTAKYRWRLLGVCWNGIGFIEKGFKPGDILKRNEILNNINIEVADKLEVKFPLGNRFYSDLNGSFFTFPGVEDNEAYELIGSLSEEIIPAIRDSSDGELWPFFTLSRPHRGFTIITKEIKARDAIASAPKIAAVLSIAKDSDQRQERLLGHGPALTVPVSRQEICPVCRLRSTAFDDDTCVTCRNRRSDRHVKWLKNRDDRTIWIDEAADRSNQVALLTVRFDLSRWLSGEWLTTIWSQTFSDWAKGESLFPSSGQPKRALNELVKTEKLFLPGNDVTEYESAKSFASYVLNNPARTECKPILEAFLEKGTYDVNEIPSLLEEIEDVYGKRDVESMLKFFFTQNPSPARLYRIWKEAEDFIDSWIKMIMEEAFDALPVRLQFRVPSLIPKKEKGEDFPIEVYNLEPCPLTVLCLGRGGQDYLTIDSLDKFRYKKGDRWLKGAQAVESAMKESGVKIAETAAPIPVEMNSFRYEHYLPYIVLSSSPARCQMILPSDRIDKTLTCLLNLYDKRFSLVNGKIPLHVGLLVAKRKFPLYSLIQSGRQILDTPYLQKGEMRSPWWETSCDDKNPFFSQYPAIRPTEYGHSLSDLATIRPGLQFWLTPGYFDFDFLGSTADRSRLTYGTDENDRPVRSAISYGFIRPRPLSFFKFRELFKIWGQLSSLSRSQRHFIEEVLATKLQEWGTEGTTCSQVFETFGKTVLRNSFGEVRWQQLDAEDRKQLEESTSKGLLLETLELFQHVLKEETEDE
jgi:CRISPR-associated Csx11 family protein